MNKKFTIVANPFSLPFEEIMLKISYMLPLADDLGFIGGIDVNGFHCIADNGKLFKSKLFTLIDDNYDTDDFDLSMHPSGWLAFDQSRTKIREFLFKVYKVLRNDNLQMRFYRPKFDNYSHAIRVGWPEEEIQITEKYIDYDYEVKDHGIGTLFSGGGGGSGIYTVLPMPQTLSVFQILSQLITLDSKDHIKYIITNSNYVYKINASHIEACHNAPIIAFTKSDYTCLLIEGFPDEKFANICNELACKFRNHAIRGFANEEYNYVRSAISVDGHPDIWLNIFKMMYEVETDVLSGSAMVKKYSTIRQSNPWTKTIRIGITEGFHDF